MKGLLFLEEGFKAAYFYTYVVIVVVYSGGAVFKHACDCIGSSLDSIQISYDVFNFYEDLVDNSVIIKYIFLIFSIDYLNLFFCLWTFITFQSITDGKLNIVCLPRRSWTGDASNSL